MNNWNDIWKFTHKSEFSDVVSSAVFVYSKTFTIYATFIGFLSSVVLRCAFNSLMQKKALWTIETTYENPHRSVDFLMSSQVFIQSRTFEPWHDISKNVVCATSKASDQPAHTRSLTRAFASACITMSVNTHEFILYHLCHIYKVYLQCVSWDVYLSHRFEGRLYKHLRCHMIIHTWVYPLPFVPHL